MKILKINVAVLQLHDLITSKLPENMTPLVLHVYAGGSILYSFLVWIVVSHEMKFDTMMSLVKFFMEFIGSDFSCRDFS